MQGRRKKDLHSQRDDRGRALFSERRPSLTWGVQSAIGSRGGLGSAETCKTRGYICWPNRCRDRTRRGYTHSVIFAQKEILLWQDVRHLLSHKPLRGSKTA